MRKVFFFFGKKIINLCTDQLQIMIRVLFLCTSKRVRFGACVLDVGTELSLGISPRADVLTQEDSAAGASEGFMLESQGPDSAAVSPRSWCFPEDEGGFSLARNGMKGLARLLRFSHPLKFCCSLSLCNRARQAFLEHDSPLFGGL